MEENVEIISFFKKFKRQKPLDSNYRVATVDEANQLLKAIRSQSNNDALIASHKLLPESKSEVFSLRDGYLFDFEAICTFYPDIENKFLWRHRLGVSRDFPEMEARLCLPLALLHACAEEDEKEIRDLVMVQSVQATFGRHVHHEREQEHRVPGRDMSRGFAAVQGSDGRISRVLQPMANYYPGIWGCRGTSSDAAAAGASASDWEQPSVYWPLAVDPVQTINSQGARLALLNACTLWPKSGGTALHFAAATGKSGVVAWLLDLEMQVMRQMQLNASASTASSSQIYSSAALITGSYMLNCIDNDGNNPLCCAAGAEEDNSKVADLLLHRDQPIIFGLPSTLFLQNKFGMSALLIAASKGHVSTLRCLLQAFSSKLSIRTSILHDDFLRQPFFEVMEGNNFLRYCVAHGDIHCFTEILGLMPSNWHSITQLMLCFPDNLGVTALELALAKGCSDICELVLKKMNELISGNVDLEILEAGVLFMMNRRERDCDGNNIMHLYALGGGSKEVGEQLTIWVQRLNSLLHECILFSSLPASGKDLYIGLNAVEAMVNQLNCSGETPCITALKRGHLDALHVLMPFWTDERQSRYLNPKARDTVLHCYAQSSFPPEFDHTFVWHHCINSSLVKQLLNTRNKYGHTPIISSLYSGQTTCSAWFLSQEDVQIEPSDHALHVYACCCDDAPLGEALQAKLGQAQVQAEINESVRLKLRGHGTAIKGTPLMLAIAQGNLQACAALLSVDGTQLNFNESMDDHQNNVLHLLCRNKSANLEECWKILVTAPKVTDTSSFAERLINARNNDGDTPLRLALKCGNMKACEWLLDTHRNLLLVDPYLDGRAVFDNFKEGALTDLAVWKKLKAAYCENDPNLLEHAKKVLKNSLLSAIAANFEDFMQHVMKDEDVVAIVYGEDTSFWSSYRNRLVKLRCSTNLIEIYRHKHLSKCFFDKETLLLAAKQGNFELFELTLQAQSYEQIEEEFNNDQYQNLLRCVLYSPMSFDLMFALILKIQVENCSSLFISWERFLNLMGEKYDAIGGWMWAHQFLAAQSMAPLAPYNMLPPSEGMLATEQDRQLMDQERHFMEALRVFIAGQCNDDDDDDDNDYKIGNIQRVLCIVRMLCQRPAMMLQGGLPLLQRLLVSIHTDNPQLVWLLLIFSAAPYHKDLFDATMLQVLEFYSDMDLVHNIHAALHFLWNAVHKTTSHRMAFLTKPVNPTMRGLPIFLYCITQFCSMAPFIKILDFVQSCHAEGMVDCYGQTALHHACQLQASKIFHTLVCMCPCLVDVSASRGRTPLMLAALSGSVEMVKGLLPLRKRGLSFERDADGRTPLHYAAQSLRQPDAAVIEVIELLLSRARQDGDLALLLWATAGHALNGTADASAVNSSIAKFLQAQMEEEKLSRSQLLKLSIHKENLVMVRDLINRGADTSAIDAELASKLGLYETKQLDQPTSNDSLGRASLSKGIASLFLNPLTSVPITVGVLGAWGMGKSSIMLQTEITLMMTIIERNLLSTKEDFPSVIQDKIITKEVEKLQHDVLVAVDKLNHPQFKHNMLLNHWPRKNKKHKDATKEIKDFVSIYRPKCMPLYKALAMMSRHKLFQFPSLENHHQTSFSLEIPTCLTIYYNAWLYHGESDASSGLALTIMKELEECMNTAQWLKLCWNYAYRLDPIFVFGNITLPLLVMVVVGGWIIWVIWKLMSIPSLANQEGLNSFKYGSIPVSTVIIAWIVLRNLINVLKPISVQILKSLNTSQKYEEKLGFQQQIINDIEFFKDHLGGAAGIGWKMVGKIWSLVVENKDNIPKSNIKKPLISNDKLRIIVFIDDLDRCSKPAYVVELLGATNLILSTCAINVVIGMNKDMIKEVVKREYEGKGESQGITEAAEKFLEKVIHIPIDLYEPNEEETSSFLEEQLMFGKPQEKKHLNLSLLTQEVPNARLEKKQRLKQSSSTRLHSIQNDEDVGSKDIQPPQSQVVVDLQDESLWNFRPLGQETKDVVIKTQASDEGFKPPIYVMQEGKRMDITTLSKRIGLYDESTSSTNLDQPQYRIQQEGNKNENSRFVVEFPLLVTNYNEAEVRVLKELQKRAKGEQKKPRNWKRLLSYHQLVRSIISHSKIERLSYIFGWQEQLIIWLFVCYNWKERMNEIFENWGKLVVAIRESPPNSLPLQKSLHLIVYLQKQKYENPPSNENLQGDQNSSNQRYLEDWRELEETLYGAYDVDQHSVNIFQKYRFHCNAGHIHWEDDKQID